MRLRDVAKVNNNSNFAVLPDEKLCILQKILLMMLIDMKNICDQNDLRFILIGGTAIGALRHNGFIPWDDDVDIAMTRADYNQFKKIICEKYNNKYWIDDPKDKISSSRFVPALRLKNTTYKTIYDNGIEDLGIFVDIYIIENTFNNSVLRLFHGIGCCFWAFLFSCRRTYENRDNVRFLVRSAKTAFKVKNGIYNTVGFCLSFFPVWMYAAQTDKWYALCKDDHTKYISIPADGPHHFFGHLYLRENICKTVDVKFDGRIMNLPREFDSYLRGIYGDYMEVPPEDKRVRDVCLKFDPGPYADMQDYVECIGGEE